MGFLSTALGKYNVEVLSTIYNVEDLEVKVFRWQESCITPDSLSTRFHALQSSLLDSKWPIKLRGQES